MTTNSAPIHNERSVAGIRPTNIGRSPITLFDNESTPEVGEALSFNVDRLCDKKHPTKTPRYGLESKEHFCSCTRREEHPKNTYHICDCGSIW